MISTSDNIECHYRQRRASCGSPSHNILHNFSNIVLISFLSLLKGEGKTKRLEILEPPRGGHTPISISGVVGQSRVYVRHLQRDIPLVKLNEVTDVSPHGNFEVILIHFMLRDHRKSA